MVIRDDEDELLGVDGAGECVPGAAWLVFMCPARPGGGPDMLEAERCAVEACRRPPSAPGRSPPASLPPSPGGSPLMARSVGMHLLVGYCAHSSGFAALMVRVEMLGRVVQDMVRLIEAGRRVEGAGSSTVPCRLLYSAIACAVVGPAVWRETEGGEVQNGRKRPRGWLLWLLQLEQQI